MKVKVFEVLSDMNVGGAGKLLLTRMALSDKEKFDEQIVIPRGSLLEGDFRNIGYEPIFMKHCNDRSFDIREIINLYKLFKKDAPDIVNAHGCLSARIAAFFARVPVRIYTRHCAFQPSRYMTYRPVKKFIGYFSKLFSTKIIAVADAAKANLTDIGIESQMIEVIINGVIAVDKYSDTEKNRVRRELGIPESAFVCGICARLEDAKGIDTLLRAARVLLRSNKDYYFMIVGTGALRYYLKELTDALGISSRVKFCGFQKDITPYLNCFDVNINCSRGTETSSLALSEAMSIGLPCVASDWGGNPYMIKDGYNGMIFPTDDFISLANCIARIHDDCELYKSFSDNAILRYKEELTALEMTRKTEKLYEELFLTSCQNREAEAVAK